MKALMAGTGRVGGRKERILAKPSLAQGGSFAGRSRGGVRDLRDSCVLGILKGIEGSALAPAAISAGSSQRSFYCS